MSPPVCPHQTCPIHAENGMEVIQRDVMDQHIKSALEKAGIHGKNRNKPLLGHAGAHGDRVALGDAHVKKPLGKLPGKFL